MDNINIRQFLFAQPNGEVEQSSDQAYLAVANRLYHTWDSKGLLQEAPDDLKKVVCLGLTGYYQDIVSDAGVWRAFTDLCKKMYGRYVPFHNDTEDYIVYELNRADVEFIVWYMLAFNSMQFRFCSPLEPALTEVAGELYKILEEEYDNIPTPDHYRDLFDCELHNQEDTEKLYDLGQWLFWRNWLMVPPFQLTYANIYSQLVEIQHTAPSPEVARKQIEEIREQVLTSMPTGPLALYLREWLSVILTGKLSLPSNEPAADNDSEHPYYTAFVKANGGQDMRFIRTYDELNEFFIKGMGWAPGEEHLPQFKGHTDFVLMATVHRGLMVAKNIAKCVKHPDNPLYDREHARKFAFTLLSQRAVCPADMLIHICKNNWLPDAHFPEMANISVGNNDMATSDIIVRENWDFIARVYLQEFYRAD